MCTFVVIPKESLPDNRGSLLCVDAPLPYIILALPFRSLMYFELSFPIWHGVGSLTPFGGGGHRNTCSFHWAANAAGSLTQELQQLCVSLFDLPHSECTCAYIIMYGIVRNW